MKARFTRADENRLGIRFEPEIFEEQLLLDEFTRASQGFSFSFSGWEHNSPGRELRDGLTAVWGQLVKPDPEPQNNSAARDTHALELLIRASTGFARHVMASTKHGPKQSGRSGPCEKSCLKCNAEAFLNHMGEGFR